MNIKHASARSIALAKPIELREGGDSLIGIVEGDSAVNDAREGFRWWILRAPRGNLRAAIELPLALDRDMSDMHGQLACVYLRGGSYRADRRSRVHRAAPVLRADKDDPSAKYR